MNTRKIRRPARRASRLRLENLETRDVPAFLPAVSYDAGTNPGALATADFNGDSILDLAITSFANDAVNVLLGNADGTFQAPVTTNTGTGPIALTTGDLDADGFLDLVTANTNGLSLLRGTGTGAFDAPIDIAVDSPKSVAVGDFNDDGTLDLGVATSLYVFDGYGYYGGRYFHYEAFANVLIGDGTGAFARTTTNVGYSVPAGSTVADLNGDGFDDFMLTRPEYSTVTVLLNDGTGAMSAPNSFDVGGFASSVVAGDLDGDGTLDLLASNRFGTTVAVLIGTGQGGFAARQTVATGYGPGSAAIGDVDRNGTADLVTSNEFSKDLSVLLGRGDMTFARAINTDSESSPTALALRDFNGDGWLDAVTIQPNNDRVAVRLNDQSWPNPLAPLVNVGDAVLTETNTGSRNAIFIVRLSAAFNEPITVHFNTANGSAVAGLDFATTSGDVTFAPGETRKSFTIPVLGDRVPESTESFLVNLTSSSAFIEDGRGEGAIYDNEPSVFIGNATVVEG